MHPVPQVNGYAVGTRVDKRRAGGGACPLPTRVGVPASELGIMIVFVSS